MTTNPFNHVDLRVTDEQEALRFYEALLPRLGFKRTRHGDGWYVFSAEGPFPSVAYFGFTQQKDHRPNANRVAFWVSSAAEVDDLAEVAKSSGARSVSGPKPMPEYSSTYYAVFFEDPSGNKLEICFRMD